MIITNLICDNNTHYKKVDFLSLNVYKILHNDVFTQLVMTKITKM